MRVRTPLDLGLLLRERRRSLGLSQQEVALRAGVGREWLVSAEQGKPRAEVGLVLRTLLALDLLVDIAPKAQERPAARPAQAPPDAVDLEAILRRARGGK